ncbi:MAG TPA: hypothetical protein VFL76_02420 [Edaphocola sp.]|nr:hypothetical protein [Edaphocola sp.]
MEKGEKILQIFESSACLKPDQILGYLKGSLFQEELRVVELHLASCNFCQEALEGLERHKDAKNLIDSLTLPPLPSMEKNIIKTSEPAPLSKTIFVSPVKKAHSAPGLPKSTFTPKNQTRLPRQRNFSWLGIGGIAALLLLGGFLFWQYENSNPGWKPFAIKTSNNKAPVLEDSTGTKDTPSKIAADQAHTVSKKVIAPPVTYATDSGKNIAAAPAINKKSAGLTDSTKAMVALSAPPVVPKTANTSSNNLPDAVDKTHASARDSQNDDHASTTAAPTEASSRKTGTKTLNKTPQKPAESSSAPNAGIGASDFQTGKSLFLKKQYASALLYLRTASENDNDPHHAEAMYYSALCNLQIGKTGRAKRLFKRVEKSDSPFSAKASEQLKQL